MKQSALKAFQLFKKDPIGLFLILKALLKGMLYIAYFRTTKRKIKIEFPFFAYAPLRIYGNGKVHIHKNCSSRWNVFKGLTIVTLATEAEVIIGEACDLGGITIRCLGKVIIGNRTLTANCLIQDTLIVNANKCRSMTEHFEAAIAKSITVGPNTWLGANTCVLCGSSIGKECVLAQGSVLLGDHVPAYHLAAGNPVIRNIRISALKALLNQL